MKSYLVNTPRFNSICRTSHEEFSVSIRLGHIFIVSSRSAVLLQWARHESQDYEWRGVLPFESFFPSPYILSEGQPINVDLAWKIQKMIKWNWRKTAIYAINDILYRQFYELPFIYKVKMRLQMGPSIISDQINAGVQKSIFGSGRSWSGSGSFRILN